jgi:dephospho-CoA kinase
VIVGLTGSVGSGKSTVARALAERGFSVVGVDREAAAAARGLGLHPGEALARVVRGDRQLEATLVPAVKARIAQALAGVGRPCVLESALLFEQGLDALCEVTVCLTCPAEVRRARVATRMTSSAGLFDEIEAAQWSEGQKAVRAGLVLSTQQPLDGVVAQIVTACGRSP